MKPAIFHPKAREILRGFPGEVRREFGKLIYDLQKGIKLSMPLSKPIPSVKLGVEELRVKDRSGIYRAFYFTRVAHAVLIFHAFKKKTQKTSSLELELGKKRLQELLNG